MKQKSITFPDEVYKILEQLPLHVHVKKQKNYLILSMNIIFAQGTRHE